MLKDVLSDIRFFLDVLSPRTFFLQDILSLWMFCPIGCFDPPGVLSLDVLSPDVLSPSVLSGHCVGASRFSLPSFYALQSDQSETICTIPDCYLVSFWLNLLLFLADYGGNLGIIRLWLVSRFPHAYIKNSCTSRHLITARAICTPANIGDRRGNWKKKSCQCKHLPLPWK